jgi:hypothetical protein
VGRVAVLAHQVEARGPIATCGHCPCPCPPKRRVLHAPPSFFPPLFDCCIPLHGTCTSPPKDRPSHKGHFQGQRRRLCGDLSASCPCLSQHTLPLVLRSALPVEQRSHVALYTVKRISPLKSILHAFDFCFPRRTPEVLSSRENFCLRKYFVTLCVECKREPAPTKVYYSAEMVLRRIHIGIGLALMAVASRGATAPAFCAASLASHPRLMRRAGGGGGGVPRGGGGERSLACSAASEHHTTVISTVPSLR